MSEQNVHVADAVSGFPGHKVVLKIKQDKPAKAEGDIFSSHKAPVLSCELSIDGKPVSGLLQSIKLEVNSRDLIPLLTFSLIPTDLDVEFDAELVRLHPQLVQAFCLTKGNTPFFVGRLENPADIDELVRKYREVYPEAESKPLEAET